MSIFRLKSRDRMSFDLLKSGTYPGKAHQRVHVKVVKIGAGEVVLKLTGYRFEAQHPLLNEASAGPWSDTEFHLRENDDIELDFKLDVPIRVNR